jgi:hypothetical protein
MSYAQDLAKAARERRIRMYMPALDGFSMSGPVTGRLQTLAGVFSDDGTVATKIAVRTIMAAVAEVHKVGIDDMLGPRRTQYVVRARFHAISLCIRLRPDLSLPTLGRVFKRDHTTIINARDEWIKRKRWRGAAHERAALALIFKDAEPMTG